MWYSIRVERAPEPFYLIFFKFFKMQTFATTINFIDDVMEYDYKKSYETMISYVVTAAAFVAAIATVVYRKWMEYDCTERLQLFAIDFYVGMKTTFLWVKNVAIPFVKSDIYPIKDEISGLVNELKLQF